MANLDSDSIIDVVTHVRACARTSVYSPVAACSVPSLNQRQSRAPRPLSPSEFCLRSARLLPARSHPRPDARLLQQGVFPAEVTSIMNTFHELLTHFISMHDTFHMVTSPN